MRFVDIRWSTEPPGVVRFDPHLTVVADFPCPDDGFAGFGSIGEMLASLDEAGDDVEAVVEGLDTSRPVEAAAQDAARSVLRVDTSHLRAAHEALHRRRAENDADMRRIELAVSRVEADATHQEALERLTAREAERTSLREELAMLEGRAPDAPGHGTVAEEPPDGPGGAPSSEARDAVSEALAEVEQIEMSEPVVPEDGSVELIDRWLDLTTSIAFLSNAEPNGMTVEQAAAAVTGARPKEERTHLGQVGPEVAEKLLELHRAVERAEKHAGSSLSGRGARRALAQARDAESEMLASVGFGDYTEYLMSVAFSTESSTLDQAEASATQVAEERVVAGDAVQLADDERWSGLQRDLDALCTDISALLGEEVSGDPLEALRNRVVLNPELIAARAELAAALANVGVDVGDSEHVPDRARAWLDENRGDDETAPDRTVADDPMGEPVVENERGLLERKLAALDAEIAVLEENAAASAVPVQELDAELAALDRRPEPIIADIVDMDPADTVAVMREALVPGSDADAPVVLDGALDDLPAACLPAAFGFLMDETETRQVVVVGHADVADFADDWLTARHGDRGRVWRWAEAVAEACPETPVADDADEQDEHDPGSGSADGTHGAGGGIDSFLVEEVDSDDDVPDLDPEPLPDLGMWTGRAPAAPAEPEAVVEIAEPEVVEPEPEPEVPEPEAVVEIAEPEVVEPEPEPEFEPEPEPEVPEPEAVVEIAEPEVVVAEPEPEVGVTEPQVVEPAEVRSAPPGAPDPEAVVAVCVNHHHRRSSTRCSKCHVPYCDDCLVQIGSGSKPRSLCVECALLTGGVRFSRRRRGRRRR